MAKLKLKSKHRLVCGDSTVITDVDKLMDGEKADMVFTDPPYGVEYQSNMRTKSEKFDVIKNDNKFIYDWINLAWEYSKGFFFCWTSWKVIDKWFDKFPESPTNIIVWNKGGGGIGDLKKTFSTDYEISLVFHRGSELKGKRIGSVWSLGKDGNSSYKHPTQKPVVLAQTAIESCSISNDLILDLFGGSGSTLIACEKTNRKCFMMELDEHYCDVIIKRFQDLTGKEAIHENGKTFEDMLMSKVERKF